MKGTVEGFEFERLRPKSEVHSTVDPELADDEKWRGQRIVGVNVSVNIIKEFMIYVQGSSTDDRCFCSVDPI